MKKNLVTVIGPPFSVLAIALAPAALADQQGSGQTPTPPPVTTTVMATPTPTPGPQGATESHVSSSSPGSSCLARLGTRNVPPTQSPTSSWYLNGDSGWAFGQAGQVPWAAPPTTAPGVGCSR